MSDGATRPVVPAIDIGPLVSGDPITVPPIRRRGLIVARQGSGTG
ncbi:hypothetical protein [Sphingomonas sp. S6]|jgi:hypothetical protein|nr:hypothetical protein [uncultured Sphingomonas sp.]